MLISDLFRATFNHIILNQDYRATIMRKVVAMLSLFVSLTRIIEGDPCFRVDNANEDVNGNPYGMEPNCTSSCDINIWIIHSKTCKWFLSTSLENLQEYRNEYQKRYSLELKTSTVSSDVANEHNIDCQTERNVTTLAVQILTCLNLEIKQFRYQMELQRNGEKTVIYSKVTGKHTIDVSMDDNINFSCASNLELKNCCKDLYPMNNDTSRNVDDMCTLRCRLNSSSFKVVLRRAEHTGSSMKPLLTESTSIESTVFISEVKVSSGMVTTDGEVSRSTSSWSSAASQMGTDVSTMTELDTFPASTWDSEKGSTMTTPYSTIDDFTTLSFVTLLTSLSFIVIFSLTIVISLFARQCLHRRKRKRKHELQKKMRHTSVTDLEGPSIWSSKCVEDFDTTVLPPSQTTPNEKQQPTLNHDDERDSEEVTLRQGCQMTTFQNLIETYGEIGTPEDNNSQLRDESVEMDNMGGSESMVAVVKQEQHPPSYAKVHSKDAKTSRWAGRKPVSKLKRKEGYTLVEKRQIRVKKPFGGKGQIKLGSSAFQISLENKATKAVVSTDSKGTQNKEQDIDSPIYEAITC